MQGSVEALARRYDVALLDLDGVVYIGTDPVPGVPEALAACRAAGIRLAFVTNNASRTPVAVADLLRGMDVSAEPDEVTTSAQAAAHYLAERLPTGSAVLVLGTSALADALTDRGLVAVRSAEEDPAAVVQGYSPELNWHALAEGAVAIGRGAMFVATNLDPTVPSARGPLPGNGSLVAALQHATGVKPFATGKPDPTMHAESVERSRAAHPIVVGDRLDTDIEGARRAGCASLLVLSGVTDAQQLLKAVPIHRPDYLGSDVSALLIRHPEIIAAESEFRCGDVCVYARGSALQLLSPGRSNRGTEDDLDGLRALAVAAWSLADAGTALTGVTAADQHAEQLLQRWQL